MFLHLIAIAWIFVTLLMALAQAMHPNGSILGAIFTFIGYGIIPLGIILYIFGTPIRKKARAMKEKSKDNPSS